MPAFVKWNPFNVLFAECTFSTRNFCGVGHGKNIPLLRCMNRSVHNYSIKALKCQYLGKKCIWQATLLNL